MTTTSWLIAAGLLLAIVLIGWFATRSRAPKDLPAPPETPIAVVEAAPPVAAPPAPVAAPVPVAPPPPPPPPPPAPRPVAPPPAPVAVPRPPPAPPPVPDTLVPPTIIMVPPPRPAAPVIERVLALEPATEGEWSSGVAVALSPVQAASVTTAMAADDKPAVYAIGFAPGATMSVARADLAYMRGLAANASGSHRWLDGSSAAVVAAVSLAGLANEHFLESLGDEMRELKSLLAAIPPKAPALVDGRLKAMVQDLSRFAREARENYVSAIGKAAFRDAVEESSERALDVWRDLVERAESAREPLQVLGRAPRFGEVQIEKMLGGLRELVETERIQEVGARALAAAHTLRVAVGDPPAAPGAGPLASAAATLQGSIESDRELFAHLVDGEKAARGDPYVGKGEFEANRAAVRKLLDRSNGAPFTVALERIEAARVAEALDPPQGRGRRLLVRTGKDGATMRLAAG